MLSPVRGGSRTAPMATTSGAVAEPICRERYYIYSMGEVARMSWDLMGKIAITMGARVPAGMILDFYTINRRPGWHDAVTNCWSRIRRISVPQLPQRMAQLTLKAFLFFSKRKIIGCIIFLLVSLCLTSIALSGLDVFVLNSELIKGVSKSLNAYTKLELLVLYTVNFTYDFFTFYITLRILQHIQESTNFRIIFLVLSDLVAASVLAVLCVLTAALFLVFIGSQPVFNLKSELDGLYLQLKYFIIFDPLTLAISGVADLFYSSTTLIPSLVYHFVLVGLVLLKVFSEIGKFIAVNLLGAASAHSRNKFPAFTMLMGLFAVIITIVLLADKAVESWFQG